MIFFLQTALNKHAKRALEELDNELEGTSVKKSAIDDDYNPNRPVNISNLSKVP